MVRSRYQLITNWLESQCEELGWETTTNQNNHNISLTVLNISSKGDLSELTKLEKVGHPIVVFSEQNPTKLLRILYEHEIKGLIHMSSSVESISLTLESSIQGQEYFDEKVLTLILSKKYNDIYESISSLSNRELEIVDGIMEEMSNDEIAEKFQLSVRTVNAHKRNILQKMKARSLVGVTKMMTQYSLRYS